MSLTQAIDGVWGSASRSQLFNMIIFHLIDQFQKATGEKDNGGVENISDFSADEGKSLRG